ncbi:MAG TPA: TatD family hydrolase [Dehalococcoidia bacterium]
MTGIIDAHAHLQSREFDADRAAVLERAWQAGLDAVVNAGDDLASSAAAVALAEADPRLFATVGVHPHAASSLDGAALHRLADLARSSPRVVAVGEIGLDFYRNLSPPDHQRRAFRAQLDLADELGLPVVIHARAAAEETYRILAAWAGARPRTAPLGVLHCFEGDADLAARYVALGFLISVPGTVTYPKNARTQEVAAVTPLDALVVETDCPYLTPQSRRGRRNEPGLITETVAKIAELRGTAPEEVARHTARNAARLFRLPRGTAAAAGGREAT